MTALLVNKLHAPVTALGYGRRLGIWTQGCSVGCRGCISMDTWPARADAAVPVSDVLRWAEVQWTDDIDGVTVTGGEPFDQPKALAELLQGLRRLPTGGRALDLLVYSGRTLSWLQRAHPQLVQAADALITGPYSGSREPATAWMGSGNQQLVPTSALGRERYGNGAPAITERSMQYAVQGGALWMIGVPAPGDLARIEEGLAERGITLGGVSWRA